MAILIVNTNKKVIAITFRAYFFMASFKITRKLNSNNARLINSNKTVSQSLAYHLRSFAS